MKRFTYFFIIVVAALVSNTDANIFKDIIDAVAPRKEVPKAEEQPRCTNDIGKSDITTVVPSKPEQGKSYLVPFDKNVADIISESGALCKGERIPLTYFNRINDLPKLTTVIKGGQTVWIPTCQQVDSLRKAIAAESKSSTSKTSKKSTTVNSDATYVAKEDISGPWRWKKVGGDRFGDRDVYRALRLMGFEPDVIQELERMIAANDYDEGAIYNGDTLEQMVSGEFEIKGKNGRKVLCDWQDGRTYLSARLYRIEMDNGYTLVIIRPDICYNWCYKWEKTPVKIETPPLDTIPLDTTPVVTDSVPEFWPDEPDEPPLDKEPDLCGIKANPRLSTWALHDFPSYGPFRRHGAGSYGIDVDVLFYNTCTEHDTKFGFTAMVDGWDGESRAGFNYYGFEGYAGPMMILTLNKFPGVYWGLDAGPGMQFDWGKGGDDYPYKSYQTKFFARLGSSLDFLWSDFHLSMWASGKFSFADGKESSLNGVQYGTGVLADEVDLPNKGHGVDGGMRAYFFRRSAVSPFIVWRESWAYDDGAISTTVGAGARFGEHLVIETSWKNRDHSKYGSDAEGNSFELLISGLWGHYR